MTGDLRVSVLEAEVEFWRSQDSVMRATVRGELAGDPVCRAVLRRWERGESLASALDAVQANRRELGL